MIIEHELQEATKQAFKTLYNAEVQSIHFEKTNPDFEGDFTLVVFNFLKISKKKPEETAIEIGEYLKHNVAAVAGYNVIKGFLNIVVDSDYWLNYFYSLHQNSFVPSLAASNAPVVMVEYSSPNTNKPLHLGHMRNILLGYSVSKLLESNGNRVIKTNLVNDRGIHICKSMLAWQKFGKGETPESSGLKGDHLVGKYYVEFDKHYKNEIADMLVNGITKEDAEQKAPLMQEAKEMLRKWEANDTEIRNLWNTMNGWVYSGFEKSYNLIGVNFDKIYYESNTYLLGKNIIEDGLANGVLQRRDDNSVFINLTEDGLDEKTLLRSDGTALYMTQDLGTALQRYEQSGFEKLIFTVGNEQDYHFKVLFLILKKLGYAWANGLYHLSYGMVELPDGKMKSREGTVVDADDLMELMINTAQTTTTELGKAMDLSADEAKDLYRKIGLGALKYFILKVDPKKKMLFNPSESIDFNGNTAPFIQFNYVRIAALLRKANEMQLLSNSFDKLQAIELLHKEKQLIVKIYQYKSVLNQAATELSPAIMANYCYDLAKEYSQYYHDSPILKEANKNILCFRLKLSTLIGEVLKQAMSLLGIEMPERM
jgi:arginyl-tRNA synthetase